MKKSNLFILVLVVPMLLTGITSCQQTTHKMKRSEFSENPQGLQYLYEVTYEDYDWGDVTKWMNSKKNVNPIQGGFGCSSVHNGNYYGRSFDFCYTDMCEFLVHTPKAKDRYASMGISIANCNLNKEKVELIKNGTDDEDLKLHERMIPFAMVDGINENGVVCNTNVVPAKDLIPHEGEEKYHTHGTNSGKPKLFYQFMPRFILDNAKSAEHAVELLKNRNLVAVNGKGAVCDYLGINEMGYELHCMIADKNSTFIVEMVDDEFNIVKSGSTIMTNFYLTNMSPSGSGLERYTTLFDNYKEGESLGGMQKLIHRVKYSPCYDPNWREGSECPMWPTEFAGCDIVDPIEGETKLTFYNAEMWFRRNWNDEVKGQLNDAYQKTKGDRFDKPGGSVPWISTHAEVYDIENKTLHLVTQEKEVNNQYDFKAFEL